MTKKVIYFFLFIGSSIGGYLPTLWGAPLFSMSSVLLSAVGGALGIWLGFKLTR